LVREALTVTFTTIKDVMNSGQISVFGHRGAKAYAPMNTIPAFELAYAQGAVGIELDVQRSKDGYPVIVHDFTVDETTNGEGYVTEKTLAELKALDAGSWFSDEFKGVQIPTLDEVFETVGEKLLVNVEIKFEAQETDGVEQVVADCIRRYNMAERVIVSSKNPYTLQRFHAIMPEVMTGFIYMADMDIDTELIIEGYPLDARHPNHEMIDEAYITWAKEHNYYINTWTVNDPNRAKELRKLGLNTIITDMPDVILDALAS
jgi:glycerophosphoryl diester phosphodiesterase